MTTRLTLQDILSDLSTLSSGAGSSNAMLTTTTAATAATAAAVGGDESRRYMDRATECLRLNSQLVPPHSHPHSNGYDSGDGDRKEDGVTRLDYLHSTVARLQTQVEDWYRGLQGGLDALQGDSRGRETLQEEEEEERTVAPERAGEGVSSHRQADNIVDDDEEDPWDLT
ncbi:uncharacterized protein PFL1_01579 [Pseudozyma flocculosa PF-1]|uniref:uncharacterized protein n=1 Tax=Pseudozyma flocculosa PF-1 TaxID=1277687 RepID=UPI0004560557|nr:uncharacterized protein PFL1_01579 [Pseudozyma flocculosa PF-1]EPQ30678.1 hypothetical protein PFL1_01579 [Pseudozyma flocculosa PF-1]